MPSTRFAPMIRRLKELRPGGLLYFNNISELDFGVDKLLISHNTCPGFNHYAGEYRQAWDKLDYYVEGFNRANHLQRLGQKEAYDPILNKNVRIAYVYRNPLDQAVSFFRHIQNHNDPKHRYFADSSGEHHLIKDEREYILNVGLESYIKQFFTFKTMKKMCPDDILMIKYETLITNPARIFAGILYHLGMI